MTKGNLNSKKVKKIMLSERYKVFLITAPGCYYWNSYIFEKVTRKTTPWPLSQVLDIFAMIINTRNYGILSSAYNIWLFLGISGKSLILIKNRNGKMNDI